MPTDEPLLAQLTGRPLAGRDRPWAITELRVTPMRVGGKTPKAWLWSDSETKPFALEVDLDNAKKLGRLLYDEADVVMEISRDGNGDIDGGKVLEVHELSDGGGEEWRAWFAEHAAEWDAIEDVGAELGRH